jgi:hypothetical protein
MQVDFTPVRRGREALRAFVATLVFRRGELRAVQRAGRQRGADGGSREAFAYFCGVVVRAAVR